MTNNDYRLESHTYVFHDTPNSVGRATIAIGSVPQELKEDDKFDEQVFYYCDTEEQFQNLFDKNNNSEFYLVKEEGEDD